MLTDPASASRPKRKLLWLGVLPPHQGGAAVSGFQMLAGLARAGHTIRTIAPITPETAGAGRRFDARHPEFGVTRFRVPHFETAPYMPAAETYRELEQQQVEQLASMLIETDRPDIILLGRETFAWRGPAVARRYALPCILRIAGGFLGGIVDGRYPAPLVANWVEQARKVDLVIAQTTSVAADLARLGLERIRIIPNGVDLGRFGPMPKDERLRRTLNIEDGAVVVMHVSNLKPSKRALDIVDSARAALAANPSLVYVIVGDGLDRQAMEDACRRQGIADRFRFVGWVEYGDVAAYLNLADLVVMPSESEAQARVYLESQACGRTLIASDIPGARHVVDDGETGLLFRKGDIADLAATILRAAGDPGLRARIGSKARDRVVAHSLDGIAAAYSAAIEDILEERGRLGVVEGATPARVRP